jgi:HPt (histidine-containing phosphotransfer) domain-containing protein
MDDYVTKPIDPRKLFQVLARWIPWLPDEAPGPLAVWAGRSEKAASAGAARPDGVSKLSPAAAEPALPGLDMVEALRRLQGNRALLDRMLDLFLTDFADAGAQFRQMLAEGRKQEAQRLAHTLKGVAANLSLPGIREAAERLDQGLRSGADEVPLLLAKLEAPLAVLVSALRGRATQAPVYPSNYP